MSPDESPVLDSEVLLRRVPSDPAKFLFPDGPIQLQAFLPTKADTDEIGRAHV